ncbi:MAG: AI-2E family transporter, partial [Bacteroidetes bacterium]|nr:AI-2E family transporter [Bacteroidota bacterium]
MTTRIPWLKAVLWLAVLVAVGMLLVYGRDLVLLVLVAAIIAYLLFPLVNNLERRGMGRTLSASVVFFGLSLILGVLGWLLIPLLAKQVAEWQEGLGNGSLYALLNQLEDEIAAYLPFIEPGTLGLSESVREALVVQKGHLLGYAGDALSVIGNLIVIPFVLFFLLRDGSGMMKKLVSLVPNRYFEFTMGVLYKIDEHLGGYLRGQSLVAVVVGLATILGLGLLGVDYYLMLGLFTGVANFIPYVGFIISAGLTLAVSILSTGGMGQVVRRRGDVQNRYHQADNMDLSTYPYMRLRPRAPIDELSVTNLDPDAFPVYSFVAADSGGVNYLYLLNGRRSFKVDIDAGAVDETKDFGANAICGRPVLWKGTWYVPLGNSVDYVRLTTIAV